MPAVLGLCLQSQQLAKRLMSLQSLEALNATYFVIRVFLGLFRNKDGVALVCLSLKAVWEKSGVTGTTQGLHHSVTESSPCEARSLVKQNSKRSGAEFLSLFRTSRPLRQRCLAPSN